MSCTAEVIGIKELFDEIFTNQAEKRAETGRLVFVFLIKYGLGRQENGL